jgi:hypothetical protein
VVTDSSTWIELPPVGDSEPEPTGLSLVVIGNGQVATHPLPASGSVTIGRSSTCDIAISNKSISRLHAALHLGNPLTIEDLDSTNGTRIAGHRIASNTPTQIRQSEVVELGGVSILVQHRTGRAAGGDAALPGELADLVDPALDARGLDALYPGDAERDRIVEALEVCRGNQTRAAAILGMSRRTLISRIERYQLPRPRKPGKLDK